MSRGSKVKVVKGGSQGYYHLLMKECGSKTPTLLQHNVDVVLLPHKLLLFYCNNNQDYGHYNPYYNVAWDTTTITTATTTQ